VTRAVIVTYVCDRISVYALQALPRDKGTPLTPTCAVKVKALLLSRQ